MSAKAVTGDRPVNLLFAGFLAYLHRQGFIIGVDHHLRLQILLNKLGKKSAPADLKYLLCPIFATNQKQQHQFYRVFDAYFKSLDTGIGEEPAPHEEEQTQEPGDPDLQVYLKKWPYIAAGFLLAVVILMLGYWLNSPPSNSTRNVTYTEFIETMSHPVGDAANAAMTATGNKVAEKKAAENKAATNKVVENKERTQVPVTPRKKQPNQSGETTRGKSSAITTLEKPEQPLPRLTPPVSPRFEYGFRWILILAPIVVFFLMEGYRRKRRRLIVEKKWGRKPPVVWPIKVETPDLQLVKNNRFYEAAGHLRRRLKSDIHQLDIDKTISNTINMAGFPVIHYKAVTRPPEYLLLIDLPSYHDHYAHLADLTAAALEGEGLFVKRYFYKNDPRVCFEEPGGARVYLSDFKTRYSDHRLIVFGDARDFLDPVTGELDDWTQMFDAWIERAVLTTRRPRDWGMSEVALARRFIVLPASQDGLHALRTFFDLPLKPDLKALKRSDSLTPACHVEDELDGAEGMETPVQYNVMPLEKNLGKDTFQWLCACAVYPELHWDLTLYLGTLPCMPAALVREENLLRLIRLPWFRTGFIPNHIRRALVSRLSPAKCSDIRTAVVDVMEKNPPPKGTLAEETYHLHLAVQRWMLSPKDRKLRKDMIKRLDAAGENQVVRDYAILNALESAPRSPLAFLLPRRFWKSLSRKRIPLLGFRSVVSLIIALTAAFALYLTVKEPYMPVNFTFKHNSPIWAALYYPKKDRILTYGADKSVILWNSKNGKRLPPLEKYGEYIRGTISHGGMVYDPGRTTNDALWLAEDFYKSGNSGTRNIFERLIITTDQNGEEIKWRLDSDFAPGRSFSPGDYKNTGKSSTAGEVEFELNNNDVNMTTPDGEIIEGAIKHSGLVMGARLVKNQKEILTWSFDGTAKLISIDPYLTDPQYRIGKTAPLAAMANSLQTAGSKTLVLARDKLKPNSESGERTSIAGIPGFDDERDKIEIIVCPFGMYSLTREMDGFSIFTEYGTLDEEKLEKFASGIAGAGANGLRDFFRVNTREGENIISPFVFNKKKPGELFFNKDNYRFNEQYFRDQRTIARVCNEAGIRYYISLFDHNCTENESSYYNPWRHYNDFFYQKDTLRLRHQYIDRLIKELKGLDAGYHICNQPKTGQAEFLADTFTYLIKKGVPPEKIILGIDYYLEESDRIYASDYRDFRDKVAKKLGDSRWRSRLKTLCISPLYLASPQNLASFWGEKPSRGDSRRVLYSIAAMTGRQDSDLNYHGWASAILNTKSKAREQGKVLIEIGFKRSDFDNFFSIKKVSSAYKDVFGQYPRNYRR